MVLRWMNHTAASLAQVMLKMATLMRFDANGTQGTNPRLVEAMTTSISTKILLSQ
jgi:hypothetical protein